VSFGFFIFFFSSFHFRVEAAVVLRSAGLTQFLGMFSLLSFVAFVLLTVGSSLPHAVPASSRPPGVLCRIDTAGTLLWWHTIICLALGFATDGGELFQQRISSFVVLFFARLGLEHSELSPTTSAGSTNRRRSRSVSSWLFCRLSHFRVSAIGLISDAMCYPDPRVNASCRRTRIALKHRWKLSIRASKRFQ
jgi:hypothetical protein